MREIGEVKFVQIQQSSLKVGEKQNSYYDPTPILQVERLRLSAEGVIGVTSEGQNIVDIHNATHPYTRNNGTNPISIGFTTHYKIMRAKFGEHLVEGIAGENIMIEALQTVTLAELGKRVAFQHPDSGEMIYFDVIKVIAPCTEFSHFCNQQPPNGLSAPELKATLQFLHEGRRGFMIGLASENPNLTLSSGYRFLVGV